VDGIADDCAENGGHGGYAVKAKDVLGSLLIALSDNGLSARLRDSLGSTVKIIQMGFSPVDLDQHARQVGAAHMLDHEAPMQSRLARLTDMVMGRTGYPTPLLRAAASSSRW
jgi:hypothetical protein